MRRIFLFIAVTVVVLWLLWPRVFILIHLNWWQALLFYGLLIGGLFLVLDHLMNRTRK